LLAALVVFSCFPSLVVEAGPKKGRASKTGPPPGKKTLFLQPASRKRSFAPALFRKTSGWF